jgi:phosphohistidine phosphatase
VRRIAAFLARAGVRVPVILHSGKKRAEQTAELLAASVGARGRVEAVPGINPLDPPSGFAPTIEKRTADTMVIGHLPFMAKLASYLIVEDEAASTLAFRPGTVVCLEREEDGSWSIAWMIRPDLLIDHIQDSG